MKIIRGSRRCPMPLAVQPVRLSQDEQRERRRTHQLHTLGGEFDLAAEVAAVVGPVAVALAAEPNPTSRTAREAVEHVAATVAELCAVAGDIVALGRTAGLDYEARRAAEKALKTVTHRPAPHVRDAELRDGTWAATFTAYATPLAGPLAAVLGRAARDTTRLPAESDRVIEALRGVDRAVLSLRRKIDATRDWRANLPTRSTAPAPTEDARRLLDTLGVAHADLA